MKEQVHGGDVYRYPDVIDFSSNMNPLGTPDSLKQAAFLAQQVRQTLTQVQPVAFLAALGRWLHESGRDKELLAYSTQYLRPLAASEEVHQGIQQMLEDY